LPFKVKEMKEPEELLITISDTAKPSIPKEK
jgi:hypothetical protein